jgi:hypothetical protein
MYVAMKLAYIIATPELQASMARPIDRLVLANPPLAVLFLRTLLSGARL